MKYIKWFILFLILIIIILVCVVFKLKNNEKEMIKANNVSSQNTNVETENAQNTEAEDNLVNPEYNDGSAPDEASITDVELVKDRNAFYTVEACIKKFFNYQIEKDNYSVYTILDQSYIDNNEVTEENVSSKLNFYEKEQTMVIQEMYQKGIKPGYTEYYVHAKIRDMQTTREIEENGVAGESDFYITVTLNELDSFYTINPNVEYCMQRISEFS